jgi:hypothetical protein
LSIAFGTIWLSDKEEWPCMPRFGLITSHTWTFFVLEFAEKNLDLFSRFIPNLVGHACSLDQEINETKVFQENLRNHEEFLG